MERGGGSIPWGCLEQVLEWGGGKHILSGATCVFILSERINTSDIMFSLSAFKVNILGLIYCRSN